MLKRRTEQAIASNVVKVQELPVGPRFRLDLLDQLRSRYCELFMPSYVEREGSHVERAGRYVEKPTGYVEE